MAMPDQPGRYRAEVIDAAAGESKSGLAQIVLRFLLTEEWTGTEWGKPPEGQEISAYQFLEKRDGSVNEYAMDGLMESFGWDGTDPFWFEDNLENLPQVQITLDYEEYQGQQRLRVKWINPFDYEGAGVKHADRDDRRALMDRLGAALRAYAGGGAVETPQRRPAGGPPAASISAGDQVWGDFEARCALMSISDSDRNRFWSACLQKVCDHDNPNLVRADQWPAIQAALEECVGADETGGE